MSAADPFTPSREARWYYAADCMHVVEDTNCALGCKIGMSDPAAFAEHGPGGCCGVLARIFLEEPIAELTDLGDRIVCEARQPI